MRVGSLCSGSGIEAAAWKKLGWKHVFFSEIEDFPCAVLRYHYPKTPNLGDIRNINGRDYRGMVDLLVAGTPCQDLSVAGKRAGLAGERSGLAFQFTRLLEEICPRWFLWENVPGVLSSNLGRDFGTLLGKMAECGYGFSYRVFNSQYFGVPQRRRRVYLVGYLGDWRPAAAVLFEPHSLHGDTAPCGKTRTDVAGTLEASLSRSRGAGTPPGAITQVLTGRMGEGGPDDKTQGGFYVPEIVAQALSCKWSKGTSGPAGDEHYNLVAFQYGDKAAALTSEGADASPCGDRRPTVIAFTERGRAEGRTLEFQEEQAYCLRNPGSGGGTHSRNICDGLLRVRRLTPLECERLQGWPDGYTDIVYKGKPARDAPRYRIIGNGISMPVLTWLGQRIDRVNNELWKMEA